MASLKKRSDHSICGFINQMTSLILLCIIFSITFVQLLHQHELARKADRSSKPSYQKAAESCEICDYLSHQKSNEYLLARGYPICFYTGHAYKTVEHGNQSKPASAIIHISGRGPPEPVNFSRT